MLDRVRPASGTRGMLIQLAGGIGLFLLGMILLTEGLKSFAGDSLQRALVRFTGTPLKAFASGALVTAMVQSSSVTTVTLIGFVSAGLLTFPQAVGVVLGASLGTTGTGWIVAAIGLKVSLGVYALPLVAAGAFMRLLAAGRWKPFGLALAGFGVIFLGIDTLTEGMQGLSSLLGDRTFPTGTRGGRLLAIAVGIAMTVIMQSSSAAVATTLTALHTDTVSFEQAALLVIGAGIGTTVTGALAVIGGTVPAKRTALSHVIFNLITGAIAIVLLPVFLWGIALAQEHAGLDAGAVSLAAFHTAFIGLGVALCLPFVDTFARTIERLLPDRGPTLTRHLDDTLLQAPEVALEATRRALRETAGEAVSMLRDILNQRAADDEDDLRRSRIRQALNRVQIFLAKIPSQVGDGTALKTRVSMMHAIDHLVRLQARLNPPAGVRRMLSHARLREATSRGGQALELLDAGMRGRAPAGWLDAAAAHVAALSALRKKERLAMLDAAVDREWWPFETIEALDALRWVERVGHHGSRACGYLTDGAPALPSRPSATAEASRDDAPAPAAEGAPDRPLTPEEP